MIEVGRLCVKTTGRDAGHTCVVVDLVDNHTVVIDGDVRRRSCNPHHLEPLAEKVDLKKGASRDDVRRVFEKQGLPVWKTTPKTASAKPAGKRKMTAKKEMVAASTAKKEVPKETRKK